MKFPQPGGVGRIPVLWTSCLRPKVSVKEPDSETPRLPIPVKGKLLTLSPRRRYGARTPGIQWLVGSHSSIAPWSYDILGESFGARHQTLWFQARKPNAGCKTIFREGWLPFRDCGKYVLTSKSKSHFKMGGMVAELSSASAIMVFLLQNARKRRVQVT